MEGLADQYKTYSDNPGLNAECPTLNSLVSAAACLRTALEGVLHEQRVCFLA